MADQDKKVSRVVRAGYTVQYKGVAYRGSAEVTFDNERDMKKYEHILENEGAKPKATGHEIKMGVTPPADPEQRGDGDTQSTDERRTASAAASANPEHAIYDAEMTGLSQELARQAHKGDDRKRVPGENLSAAAAKITVEQPVEGRELGAPLLRNSPDQSKPKPETATSKPGGKEAQAAEIARQSEGTKANADRNKTEEDLVKEKAAKSKGK